MLEAMRGFEPCEYLLSCGIDERSVPPSRCCFRGAINGLELQFASASVVGDEDGLVVLNCALENQASQWGFDLLLDGALERPGAVSGIISNPDQVRLCGVVQRDSNVALGQPLSQPFQLNLDDDLQVFFSQAMEDDDLVNSVQKLRPEMAAQLVQNGIFHPLVLAAGKSAAVFEDAVAPDI